MTGAELPGPVFVYGDGPRFYTDPRFFLDRDNDGHWYVINANHREAWEKWVAAESEESAPPFADPIGGSHTLLTFTDPRTI